MRRRCCTRSVGIALTGLVVLFLGLVAGPASAAPGPGGDWPDQVTLYAIPAPRPLKWQTPRRLALGVVGNEITVKHTKKKHTIGHVAVRIRSSLAGREVLTGMTNRVRGEDFDLLLKDGYGLGILGADMMGRLETAEELEPEIAERAATGRIASLRFLVAPEATVRMLRFLEEYRAKGLDDHYGGANRPRYGEGGGCSAFGVAFLEVAGLMHPGFDSWKVALRAPLGLYGGPLHGLRSSLKRTLFEGDRWAREDEPHQDSIFWDPTAMYLWIRRIHAAESACPSGDWATEVHDRMEGLVGDARSVPVPDEPLWLEVPPEEPHPFGRQDSVRRDTYDREREDPLATREAELRELLAEYGEVPGEADYDELVRGRELP